MVGTRVDGLRELRPGPGQALAHRLGGEAQDQRGLAGLQAFHHHEQQHLAVRLGQPAQRSLEAALRIAGHRQLVRRRRRRVRPRLTGTPLTQPVAPNSKPDGSDDPEGRQKNRRVEITLKKQ